ncbi:MAG: GtrA family protein [Nocardia sp.]|nr:GtrA family protein [Nocardia sp.]
MVVQHPVHKGLWKKPQTDSGISVVHNDLLSETPEPRSAPAIARQLLHRLRGDHWLAQLIRFAIVGGLSNIAYFLLFLVCYGGGAEVSNLIGSIASTVLANELHRRLTFRAADRVGFLTGQLEGGGLALVGLAISSGALALVDVIAPRIGDMTEAVVVIAITAAVGLMRFVTLRIWVF